MGRVGLKQHGTRERFKQGKHIVICSVTGFFRAYEQYELPYYEQFVLVSV
jgi:hypothetical protein